MSTERTLTASTLSAGNVKLLGGALCLDFANTANWHKSEHPVELLLGYDDLVAWAVHTTILTEDEAALLVRQAAVRPVDAEVVRVRAIELREAIYRIFVAISEDERPEVDDLELLNSELQPALSHARIVEAERGFTWDWADEGGTLDRMLWPVARSAAELLSSAQLYRARQCADARCGWLFLDMSRNGSRRWCSMEECGNRNKARNYYRRQQNAD
ncbi:MAG TPA: ABATE domain-containing protein [Nitrolancea sp.]|jgi:predicted RNA-binding Zn ribbon-like protein|nr:ABATE domain-containing protein [Nitrolancea sp.]